MTMTYCFRRGAVLLVALAVLLPTPATAAKQKGPKQRDIADTIIASPILTKFATLVQAADLGTFLSSRGPFTVFAPADSAFSKLQPGMLELLMQPQNKERLQAIVLFHVVNNKRLLANDLVKNKTVLSCDGNNLLTIKTSKLGTIYVQKAKLMSADIKCANGIVHQVDSLMMPPDATLPPILATPPPALVTNAPPANMDISNAAQPATNASSTNTDDIPVAPVAKPEDR
jgi:uncharacterized surface protein with fasciclin (FAS1) repeats